LVKNLEKENEMKEIDNERRQYLLEVAHDVQKLLDDRRVLWDKEIEQVFSCTKAFRDRVWCTIACSKGTVYSLKNHEQRICAIEEKLGLYDSETIAAMDVVDKCMAGHPDVLESLINLGIELKDSEGKPVEYLEGLRRIASFMEELKPDDPRMSQLVEILGGAKQIARMMPLLNTKYLEVRKRGFE